MQRGNYNWNTNDEIEELRRRLQRSNISRSNTSSTSNNGSSSSNNTSSTSNTASTGTFLPVVGATNWAAGLALPSSITWSSRETTTSTTTTTTTHYCPHSSCYRTVSYSGEYCSQHQRYCQASSCYNRIPSYEDYCSTHKSTSYQTSSYSSTYSTPTYYSTPSTHYCEASGCYSSISYSESYCYSHLNSCRDCSTRISSGQTYCSSHQNSYCYSCSTQIPRGQSYCYSHANGCYSCGQRINQGQSYCYQHTNQCSYCSTRISSGQSVCPSHQNRSCYTCGATISYSDAYCYNHKNACQSCSQRISYGQSYCYSHLGACQTCSIRIPSGQTYCSSHVLHKCQEALCSNQINISQPYCPSHINACQENNCSARISTAQNYCSAHKKQTLQKWWEEGKITDIERKKLGEFNLNNEYSLKQLKEILEEDACINDSPIISNTITGYIDPPTVIRDNLSNSLKRIRPKLALTVAVTGEKLPGPFVEIVPFSTWFNENCATVISKLEWAKLFDVWMTVCEKPVRKMEGLVDIIWDSEYSDISKARGRAAYIREKINGDRPVLCICPSLQVFYNNSDYLFVNIIKVDVPITDNPSEYLLPLDIIERSSGGSTGSSGKYRHAAIYLGRDPKENGEEKKKHKVCHIFAPGPSKSEMVSTGSSVASGTIISPAIGSVILSSAIDSEKKKAKTRIDDWETFLTDNPKELIRYRITIPFKRHEKEIEQIAKAVVTEFGKGNYHAVDRNCEHFAFAIACGVNFSEQEQTNRDRWYRKFLYCRGSKISQIDLEREMNKNDELFDNLVSSNNEEVVKKFEEVKEQSKDREIFKKNDLQQGGELIAEVRVIIPPKYHNWK